jgi:hypothetical protein
MPVLTHAAVSISIALEDSPGLFISQPEVACAIQVSKDTLNGLSVWNTGVCGEMGDSGDCECDVRMCHKGSLVKGTDSLTVGLITHDHMLCRGCGWLIGHELNGGVHGWWEWLELIEVVATKDWVDVCMLGLVHGVGFMISLDLHP